MFEKLLSKIGLCLEKHSLPYMIIGGQAVLLYGEPRLTRDIDITLGVNIDHLDRLLSAVRELPLKPLPQACRCVGLIHNQFNLLKCFRNDLAGISERVIELTRH